MTTSDGKKWTINGIDLSKPLTELTIPEIAYLIAYGMISNKNDDGIFNGTVADMARAYYVEASDEDLFRVRTKIPRWLRANGFAPHPPGSKGLKWRTPADENLSTWRAPEDERKELRAREPALRTGEPSDSGPVRTSYTCPIKDCLDHRRGVRMSDTERVVHLAVRHGTDRRNPVPSQEKVLVAAVKKKGRHPRDIARMTGLSPGSVSAAGTALKAAGLLESRGATDSSRYYPVMPAINAAMARALSANLGNLAPHPDALGYGVVEPPVEQPPVEQAAAVARFEPKPAAAHSSNGGGRSDEAGQVVFSETGEELRYKGGKLLHKRWNSWVEVEP